MPSMYALQSKLTADTPETALATLRALAAKNRRVQLRLARLGLLVALGRTVKVVPTPHTNPAHIGGHEAGVQAFQTAISAYAAKILAQRGLRRVTLSAPQVLSRARQAPLTLSVHHPSGWITATYHLRFDGDVYHVTANDRRSRQLSPEQLLAILTTTFTLTTVEPQPVDPLPGDPPPAESAPTDPPTTPAQAA